METSENLVPNRELNSESPGLSGVQPPDCGAVLDLSETDYAVAHDRVVCRLTPEEE
jgi:hypothetical protein